MKKIFQWLFDLFKKQCKHEFRGKEVTDLNHDPRCIHCQVWLSKLTKNKNVCFGEGKWKDDFGDLIYPLKKI